MKNFFKSLVVGALLLGSVGCSDMFKEDLYEINQEIDKINARIDSLCNAVNTNIASLQTIIDVMQDNDYVDSIVPIVEGGETVGYEITFTQSGSVKIYHGKKGETGATGHTPVVSVKQAEDGRWYWTVDGEYLLDGNGDKILAEAIDGEDGATGADGITPQLKVEGDYWYISYDNKATWERLGKATGEAGKDGDSMFKSVTYNDEYVELVLVDGTVLRIPTWASHMLLVDEIAKINSNISALQAAVKALESNDYVQKVTPVKDSEGNIVGYTLQFVYAGDVTIYHGEDGKDGEDGEDGKDGVDGKDGHTPVIGVRQHPDGIWYWTIDGEWLLDKDGNRVRTTGQDGTIGITPELKIENDYWYVSYDKGQTWTKLGKAKGEDGAAGGDGAAGDAFFKNVDTSDEYYIILTLTDGTTIKIPTWKAHQALADAVAQLNTNFESLQVIITGLQNHDYITGYTPIIDPQTNEEIGYTLHFLKAGDIEIYHGTSPAAPEIGIKKHPQYGLCWTYNGDYIKDPGTGKPVALPQDGADAVAPKFKIEDGRWWMSTDGGRSWEDIGQATGDQGQQGETGATGGSGDSFFKSIVPEYATDANGNVLKDTYGKPIVAYIVMTLAGDNDGEDVIYKVPTEYVTDDLNKRLAAIEAQFSTISTIVNALQNAEYIKEVVELYEGPALVGYEITFVKYAIGADGKLTETTRKSTIRNGGAGAAGTVVAAEYDEATDTWYWTLDGKPLKDADGNYVAINGKNGQAGVTPLMRINTDTNEWEVSYDNGKTYTSTGVKATGPQGPQGNPGQGGAAGDSFFSGVSKDGDYWVFELVSGEKIMVPTAEAFASLAERVAALEKSAESILSLVNGKKYIESCEPFSNDSGSGYHLVLVSLNAETGEATKEDCFIYNGIAGNTPVVGLRQDEATGDWYWTVDGEDLLVDGKPVKANGPQGIDGPVPSFRIDAENGHLYVTVNGTETDLGRVVGTNGSAGEAGTDSSINVNTAEDGKVTITFIGGDGKTSTIEVPSWAVFVELQEIVNDLNANVEALQAAVTALQNNDYVIAVEDVTDEVGEVVGYKLVFAKSGEKVIYHGKKGDKGEDAVAPRVQINPQTNEWEISTDGGQTWTSTGVSAVGPKGDAGATPKFKIENGMWYVSYDNGTTWSDPLGQATGNTGATGTSGASFFESVSEEKDEEGNITYIVIVVPDDTPEDYTDNVKYRIPTAFTFAKLEAQVSQLNSNVAALQTAVVALENNDYVTAIEDVKDDAGNVIGYKLTFAKSGEKTIYHGAKGDKGEDAVAPRVQINAESNEWEISTDGGETWTSTGVSAVGPKGDAGATPKFKIENGEWYVSYDNGTTWSESLGQATGDKGETGSTGTSGASFFESVSEERDSEDNVTYIVITVPDDNDDPTDNVQYRIPTAFTIAKLEAQVSQLNSNVEALQAAVTALENNDYVTAIEDVKDDAGNVIGYKLTFAKSGEKTIYHGKKGDKGDNAVAPQVRINSETNEWEISTDGGQTWVSTDVVAVGDKGDAGATPKFKIENGQWYVSYDNGTTWSESLGQATGDKGETGSTGTSGASFFESVSEEKDSEGNVTYIVITVPDNTPDNQDDNTKYRIPTAYTIAKLEARVEALENNIKTIDSALSGLSFVKNIEPVYDNETNKNIIGFKVKFVRLTGDVANNNATFVEDDEFTTYTASNYVVPVKEDDVWYWYANGTKLCAIDGTFVPEIVLDGGYIYVSKPGATTFDADKAMDEATFMERWYKLDGNLSQDTDTYGSYVVETDGSYTITFPGLDPINVGKYYATPSITFSTDGTLALGNNSSATVTCTITGSFTAAPTIYATCEGHFTSTASAVSGSGNTYTTTITVKPTTAYDTTLEGKLTVYCPYYGTTGIGQLNLTATGAGIGINSVSKSGNDTQATITVDGIVEQSGEELTLKAVDGDPSWISMGNVSNPSNTKLQQTLTLNPYVIGSKEDLENGQVRQERTCTLAVVTPSGREAGYVAVNQAPIINLADQGSANCYIISAPGRYMIPARKGNSTNALWSTRPSNVSVTKTTDDGKNTVNFTSDQILFEYQGKDYIIFDIPNSIQNGNTVIALKSGNEVLWSWHLWFCGDSNDRPDSESTLERYPDDSGNFNGYRVMNRALGATTSEGLNLSTYGLGSNYGLWQDGLYYQWGRKDPLATITSKTGGSYDTAKQNPNQFYSDWNPSNDSWANDKTVNDPCPPGYKVPSSKNVWRQENPDKSYSVSVSGTTLMTLTNNERYTFNTTANVGDSYPSTVILYPYCGYYKADGSSEPAHKEDTAESTTSNYTYGYSDDVKVGDKSYAVNIYSALMPIRITDVKFRFKTSLSQGAFWANDGNTSMRYGYEGIEQSGLFSDIEILGFSYQTATVSVTSSGRIIKTYEVTAVTWSAPITTTNVDALTSSSENWSLAVGLMKEDLQNNYKSDVSHFIYDIDDSLGKSSALQVRCVKE